MWKLKPIKGRQSQKRRRNKLFSCQKEISGGVRLRGFLGVGAFAKLNGLASRSLERLRILLLAKSAFVSRQHDSLSLFASLQAKVGGKGGSNPKRRFGSSLRASLLTLRSALLDRASSKSSDSSKS
jgi:hypothetical protein